MILIDAFAMFGMLLSCALAYVTISRHSSWRLFSCASSLIGLLALLTRGYLTESPRYYITAGQPKHARNAIYQVPHSPLLPTLPQIGV